MATAMEAGASSTGMAIGRDRSMSDAAAVHILNDPRPPEAVHLPRSASYTYFPPVKDLEYNDPSVVELKGGISETDLTSSRDEDSPYSSSGGSTPENERCNVAEPTSDKSADPPSQPSRISLSRFLSSAHGSQGRGRDTAREKEKEGGTTLKPANVDQQAVSPKRSLTQLRRQSWVSSGSKEQPLGPVQVEDAAGSPRASPEKRRGFMSTARRKSILHKGSDGPPTPPAEEASPRPSTSRRKSILRRDSDCPPAQPESWTTRTQRRMSLIRKDSETPSGDDSNSKASRKGTVLTKRPRKPSDAHVKPDKAEEIPPVPDLPKSPTMPLSPTLPKSPPMPSSPHLGQSFSTDRLPYLIRSPPSSESVPSVPGSVPQNKLKTFSLETPKKKDELWGQFRTLDGEFQKFSSKSIALKANVVRQSLLPFLRSFVSHPSNNRLRVEDLDRRTNILNKWWTGLLEMINGKNNQSISGSDRPHILQGIVGIMERPEWRSHPSPFCPLAGRNLPAAPSRSTSSTSLASAEIDFLTESVHHNVRNTFIQNLTAQMAFVVEKMSLRNAPATLVTFGGKTCAYAFFFCPGMADILVRLWSPSLDAMRRVMSEFKVSERTNLDETSKRILLAFPPSLHSLGLANLHKTFRDLRKPAPFPLGTSTLPWYGSWVKRWSGTESDLFYVFTKCYHIIVTDFLPTETTSAERLCVPGLVMVQAQILINLDETLHRHAALSAQKDDDAHMPSSVTFDDVLADGPDVAASALPIPPANAVRLMAENRLIMLLRDFLSAGSSHLPTAPHIFAESFSRLLQASARRVSMFDHNASYTLCDFLEEALMILLRYERTCPGNKSVLDWSFWISVYKRMTESHNTTTEIRLISFLYSIWGAVVEDQGRKAQLCLDFLLEPDFFESRFNHWCPMLRAYFMRLICWRVARFDEEATDSEVQILKRLEERLQSVWCHFLYLQETSQARNEPLPSTSPCNPAPGRRLLIIRHDAPMSPSNGPFISFDGIVSNAPRSQPTSYNSHSSLSNQLGDTDIRPTSAMSIASDSSDVETEENGKKRWSLLRSLLRVPQSRGKSRSPDPPSRQADTSSSSSSSDGTKSPPNQHNAPSPPSHRTYCFRFSLEWVNDKRFQTPGPMRLSAPRLPPHAHNFLLSQRSEEATPLKTMASAKPEGSAATSSKYAGRALCEWAIVVGEYHSFFQRRKDEGVPANKLVETPTLGVEVFRRPG